MTDQTERVVAILPQPIPADELVALLGTLKKLHGPGTLYARSDDDALQIIKRSDKRPT